MRPYLLTLALVACVCGRPEPPIGYNYPSPSSNIGTGFSSLGSSSLGGASFNENPTGQGFTGLSGSSGFGGYSYSGAGSIGGTSSLGIDNSGVLSNSGSISSTGVSGSASRYNSGETGQVQVHKHVYVHVAPEEPEEIHQRANIPIAPRQKHYKIIFIKAPSPPAPIAPQLAAQAQNEEKTLVYVLVKKPEDQSDIVIPTAAPTKPSKPEVYFIKYKTNKEQISAGNAGISADSGVTGDNVSVDSGAGNDNGVGVSQSFSSSSNTYPTGGSFSSGLSSKYGPPEVNSGPY